MQLVLNTYGIQLSQRNRCFQVESKIENRIISPVRVTSILVTKSANITSSAILLAAEHSIPVVLVDSAGQPVVKINPLLSAGLTALRKKQLAFARSVHSYQLVRQMLLLKTQGQLSNLALWGNRKTALENETEEAKKKLILGIEQLMNWPGEKMQRTDIDEYLRNWEAQNARRYWQVYSQLATAAGMAMKGRTYRPAEDECNAAINYLYGMLYNQVETALACAGLDSQIGLWHRDNYQTPSLAFDAIEPLRPKADKLMMEIIFEQKLNTGHFETNEKYGYLLNKKGKEILIPLFNAALEERIKMNGKVTALKNHILQQAYHIKQYIEKQTGYE
jgi:CRISP-associated protein Cas1